MLKQILDLPFHLKALTALVALALAGGAAYLRTNPRQRLPLPPGPPGHWWFGNTLPKAKPSEQFAAWINQYGPVISLRVGSKIIVIIGRQKESVEIMEKEGAQLADRPRTVAAGEILSHGIRLILAPAGEQLRRLRRATHTHFQAKVVESYEPIHMHAARDVILDILSDPKHHQAHVKRYASAVILRITYGKSTPTETNAPEIIAIHKIVNRFQMLVQPGAMLVEKYPILKYLPFYTRQIDTWRREESKVFHDLLSRVSKNMAEGDAGPSFGRYLLEDRNTHKLSNEEMVYLAGALFGAGADTTAVSLMVVVMAAACHPEAQLVVQDELDYAVGCDRAPTFNDYDALPQVRAFMLECHRWRPVTTLGFAHRALADIPYKNFCIPKGAIVYGNHWAISRDPEIYPNPDKFDPQRWLDGDGKIRDDIKFPIFGFGRRVCPGLHVANQSVFLNTALLLWSFHITQDPNSPINTNGFADATVAHPSPFDACFTPRFNEAHLREVMAKYAEDL